MYIKVETENTSVPDFTCAFSFYLVRGGLCIYRREDGSEGSRPLYIIQCSPHKMVVFEPDTYLF